LGFASSPQPTRYDKSTPVLVIAPDAVVKAGKIGRNEGYEWPASVVPQQGSLNSDSPLEIIQRTRHPLCTLVQHMRVNHGGLDILMPQ
jgi:hypothetical protein